MFKRWGAMNNFDQGEATLKTQHPVQFIAIRSIRQLARYAVYALVIIGTTTLFACASSPSNKTTTETDPQNNSAATTNTAAETQSTDTTPQAVATQPESTAKPAPVEKTAAQQKQTQQQKPQSPQVIASCKNEPYIGYEQQARQSIQKGLAATQAQKFGVGFRDMAEHQKWSETHNTLFNKTTSACEALSKCTNANKSNLSKCATQAQTFQNWQAITKNFATKAKMAETTQPPKICSLKPNLTDAPRCFHQLADKIVSNCNTEECKELSHCWNGVGYLDGVIIQATQSCGFVHQDLNQCRSYQEATTRRKNKFAQCEDLQNQFGITSYPVL